LSCTEETFIIRMVIDPIINPLTVKYCVLSVTGEIMQKG
jgi:hypothetical protein